MSEVVEIAQPALRLDREKIEAAAIRLYAYVPEVVPELKNPVCQQCGWESEEHEEAGEESPDHEFDPGPPEDMPFFSEAFLYDLMGKSDARTILALVNGLVRSVGLSTAEMEEKAATLTPEQIEELPYS